MHVTIKHKRLCSYQLLVGVLLTISPSLFARNLSKGYQMHLQAGYTAFDSYGLAQIDGALAWKTGLTYTLPFGLQFGPTYGQARTQSILNEQARVRTLAFDISYLVSQHRFTPFVKASLGYQWTQVEQIDNYQGTLYGAGVGVVSRWNEIISTRLGFDLDFVRMQAPIDQIQTNWTLYLGASLNFGPYHAPTKALPIKTPRSQPQAEPGLIAPQTCKNIPPGVPVDEYGCPLDFDGDFVPDYTDLCPATQTQKVDQMGCPLQHFARGVIQNISFQPGSAHLTATSYKNLKKIANALKRFSQLLFVIEGHTDNTGQAQANLTLSNARAQTVKNTLVQYGLVKENIETIGFGKQYPIAPNTTKQGRALNRRIEIKWKQP